MAAKNTKNMHEVFGRNAVVTHDPDTFWPLPSELIGIEIEVEELNRAGECARRMQPYWTTHSDGSLRNGTEFVLAAPTGGRQLTEAINTFFDARMSYSINPRTSIHVHINASDNMTVDHFRNMFVIMYLIEPAIFRWADENRKWCGYCAPLTDLTPNRIINILNDDRRDPSRFIMAVRGDANHDRYYGFNVAAYNRHGTVEFRYFPCTTEKEAVIAWVKFCMYVKKAARRHGSPEDILALLQTETGLTSFINEWFGDVAAHILRNLDMADCLGRVKDMGTMVNVQPETLRSEPGRSVRSRGLARYLNRNFPNVAAQAATATPSEASSASDLYRSFTATPTPRPRATSRTNDLRSISGTITAAMLQEARREYDRAAAAYVELPTTPRRARRDEARREYDRINLLYIQQNTI